jgi:(E)-4-hydroxy-3-methylbut-2-enyl-diphosphate synthase
MIGLTRKRRGVRNVEIKLLTLSALRIFSRAYYFKMKPFYCSNLMAYHRRLSREVSIGGIPMGGNNPIRLQSMTNTDTSDIAATVNQIVKIVKEGADYVRLTVPGKKDAENLSGIVAELAAQKCMIPLIADIHFNPRLALIAASIVDKVRINPGNFADKKLFKTLKLSEKEYREELSHLHDQFVELLALCKKNGTAIRIGTNHGSLSDRIMSRYGDTPEGMAESAMEFLRICKEENFGEVVVSMKASNTRVMVYATRLLVSKMEEEAMNYPIHLGVTEAGEGEDGRIKSAVGIGTLLCDGIGDTIRVSLTEEPEIEIPVARKMVDYLEIRKDHAPIPAFERYPLNPFDYRKRTSQAVSNIGGNHIPVVFHTTEGIPTPESLKQIGWIYSIENGWSFTDLAPDYLFVTGWPAGLPIPREKGRVVSSYKQKTLTGAAGRIIPYENYMKQDASFSGINFVLINASDLLPGVIHKLSSNSQVILIVETDNANGFADQRAAIFRLINQGYTLPVIFKRSYSELLAEDLQLKASMDFGGLFIDGLGDGIWIENSGGIEESTINSTAFGILQASRVRISKTEFISCPSCGRTLFDLQSTTKKIRERTHHLKGLKIGIMGCIVNGPGEMADADYGYVGTGKGNVTLYKEKNVIRKNLPEAEAVDALIELIKENGDWIDP